MLNSDLRKCKTYELYIKLASLCRDWQGNSLT